MTDSEILHEIYLEICTIRGYLEGMTQGIVKRLEGIEKELEELRMK